MGRYSAHLVTDADIQDTLAEVTPGTPVKLVPEPENPDDPRAIKAILRDGRKVGNVERESWLTRTMFDDKLPVASRVQEVFGGTSDQPIRGLVLEVLTGAEATEALARTNAALALQKKPAAPSLAQTQSPTSPSTTVATLEGTGKVVATVISVVLFVLALFFAAAAKENGDLPFKGVAFLFLLPSVILYPPLVSLVKSRFGIPRDTNMHVAFTVVGACIGLGIAVATTAAWNKAHPEIVVKREADRKAKQGAEQTAAMAPVSTEIPKGLDRDEMLKLAREAQRANAPDRGLAIIFDNAPPEMLREDTEVKFLVADLESRLKTLDAPNAAKEFSEKVRTYWIPEINGISTAPPGSVAEVWTTTGKLEELARTLEDGDKLPLDIGGKKAYSDMRAALSAKQRALFPVLRSAFAKTASRTLWENEIDVRTGGPGNRVITWTGPVFAARANIARAQEGSQQNFTKLRFTSTAYEWVRGIGQTYTYRMSPPADDAVGYWDGARFVLIDQMAGSGAIGRTMPRR